MCDQSKYIVLGCKPWNRRIFDETIAPFRGRWSYCAGKNELTLQRVNELAPRYLFFLHWSWVVPASIVNAFECVGFHMTDLPYGRGGSPLQNLITRGHKETMLSAYRMVEELDAGPIYAKEKLSLSGTAEEILVRATRLSATLIQEIVSEEPVPTDQCGEPKVFERRTPGQSRISKVEHLEALYDFVRMLDAETYPRAFVEHEGLRYEFRDAQLCDGNIEARVSIFPIAEREQ